MVVVVAELLASAQLQLPGEPLSKARHIGDNYRRGIDLRKCEICITGSRTVPILYYYSLLANWHLAGTLASDSSLRWVDAQGLFVTYVIGPAL